MAATQSAKPVGFKVDGTKFTIIDGATEKEILGLKSLPALGSGERELLDTTTLNDDFKKSIFGKADYGTMEYTFLYDNKTAESNYRVLSVIESTVVNGEPKVVKVKVELPDGTTFSYDAVISLIISENDGSSAMEFVCKTLIQSKMEITNPTNA